MADVSENCAKMMFVILHAQDIHYIHNSLVNVNM